MIFRDGPVGGQLRVTTNEEKCCDMVEQWTEIICRLCSCENVKNRSDVRIYGLWSQHERKSSRCFGVCIFDALVDYNTLSCSNQVWDER